MILTGGEKKEAEEKEKIREEVTANLFEKVDERLEEYENEEEIAEENQKEEETESLTEETKQPEEITDFVENHSDIPLPKDSILKEHRPYKPETLTTAQQDETFTYIAFLSQEETIKFYKKNMSQFGWESAEGYGNAMFFEKGINVAFIGVDKKGENESTITIMIGK